MLEQLKKEARVLGKKEWRAMLSYVADLHERSVREPRFPFKYPWEEIGPGYVYGPAFGHWDIIHQIIDVLPSEPDHAKNQILNDLQAQEPDGLIPGVIYIRDDVAKWSKMFGHPPVWPAAVQDYCDMKGDKSLAEYCLPILIKQINWFENKRKAQGIGFYYLDILTRDWESGVDEGVRFDDAPRSNLACVDATAHVYWLYSYAAQWSEPGSVEAERFLAKAQELKLFIQQRLFDEQTGFFYDIWSVDRPDIRHLSYEGMWPMVVGAATAEQANWVIDENLLHPEKFFTVHPIATVAQNDPKFELRMWRGPSWNSMTYWAARGCCLYNRQDAAHKLLEAALDASARQFERTGTIWEFYHPLGGNPMDVQRKPQTQKNTPCHDYLGHNPLLAMARLWELTR